MDNAVSVSTKIALLKKQVCFSQLTAAEIEELATLLVEKNIKSGEKIVTEGDVVDSIYIIVQGSADVRCLTINQGKATEQSVAVLGPDAAIGLNERGFYSLTGKRTATVIALSDMVVLRLSVAEFHGFSLAYHHVNEVMRKNAEDYMK